MSHGKKSADGTAFGGWLFENLRNPFRLFLVSPHTEADEQFPNRELLVRFNTYLCKNLRIRKGVSDDVLL